MDCLYWVEQPLSRAKGPECLLGLTDSCGNCCHRLSPEDRVKWADPLVILDRTRQQTHSLRNMLAGGRAFLLCGGPSANEEQLELLGGRGMWTLAVNNSAGHPRVRPQAFICSDPPSKFSHSIWLDPTIIKLIPTPKLSSGHRGQLRKKIDGKFQPLDVHTPDCPNVWGFQRHSWLVPDDRFFQSNGALWGNHQKGVNATGQDKTVCTMLLGLRLLYYLGARTIFLVGVDFRMAEGYGYSFNQGRDAGAIASNNTQFAVVNRWLTELQQNGAFDRFGLRVYNTFALSGLRAFPFVPFEKAVAAARGIIETTPDLSHWYDPAVGTTDDSETG